jgi:hypothetical protein
MLKNVCVLQDRIDTCARLLDQQNPVYMTVVPGPKHILDPDHKV